MPPTPAYPLPDSTSGVGLRAQISREVLTAGGKNQKIISCTGKPLREQHGFFRPVLRANSGSGPVRVEGMLCAGEVDRGV